MSEWPLCQLLSSLHDDIQQRLATVRKTFSHPGTKGARLPFLGSEPPEFLSGDHGSWPLLATGLCPYGYSYY